MRLPLASQIIYDIKAFGSYLYYHTAVGIEIFTEYSWSKKAYLTASVSCIAVNAEGLFYGTASGIYFISSSAINTGGDLAGQMVLKFHTGSTPSLLDNNVTSISAYETKLVVTSTNGITYIPNTGGSTKYTFSVANANNSDAAFGGFAVTINGTVVYFPYPSANFTIINGFTYKDDAWLYSDLILMDAAVRPSATLYGYNTSIDNTGYSVYHSGSPYVTAWTYDENTELFTKLTLSPARASLAYPEQTAIGGGYFIFSYNNVPIDMYDSTGTRTFTGLTYTQTKYSTEFDLSGVYVFVAMNNLFKLLKRTDGSLAEVQTVTAPWGGGTVSPMNICWCEKYPEYCILFQYSTTKPVTLYKRNGDTLTRMADLTSPNVLSGYYVQVTKSFWIDEFFVCTDGSRIFIYELVGDALLLRYNQPAPQITPGVASSVSYMHRLGKKMLLYLKQGSDSYGVRVAYSILKDPNTGVLYLQPIVNTTEAAFPTDLSLSNDYMGPAANGRFYFNASSSYKYAAKRTVIPLGTDFTTANKLLLLDDCIIVGTDTGLRVFPLPYMYKDTLVLRERGFKFSKLYSVIKNVAGFDDIRFLYADKKATRELGNVMYGGYSGSGYKIGMFNLTTLG